MPSDLIAPIFTLVGVVVGSGGTIANSLVQASRTSKAEHDFEKALKKAKVVENQQQIDVPWFPNKALGAGLAQWACESSSRFAKSW